MPSVAFFDLDLTIISRNSGSLWVRHEVRAGHITRWQSLKAFGWLARYRLGFARLEEALQESVASYAGQLEQEIRDRTLAFFEAEVRGLVRPGAREALRRHREAGDRLWLLTSSSNYLSEAVAAQLGLDGILCNRLEVDAAGRFTGRPLGGLCYGPGKVQVAQGFAREQGILLSDCAFYSDSVSDLPMLEAVGHPVAVNPDPRLRRAALKRGWPVADWGEPDVAAPAA